MKKFILYFIFVCSLFSEPIDPVRIAKENQQYISEIQIPQIPVNVQSPEIFCKSSLPIFSQVRTYTIKLQNKTHFPDGTKFVFFGIDDVSRQLFKKERKFDYGYCISFKSFEEIKKFKEENQLNFPIGIANDEILKEVFKASCYPVIVEIKGASLIITEGFK